MGMGSTQAQVTKMFRLEKAITITSPVVQQVSQATRDMGSWRSISSRIRSEIWSQILSGCPSVTDSEVNTRFMLIEKSFLLVRQKVKADLTRKFSSTFSKRWQGVGTAS